MNSVVWDEMVHVQITMGQTKGWLYRVSLFLAVQFHFSGHFTISVKPVYSIMGTRLFTFLSCAARRVDWCGGSSAVHYTCDGVC